MPSATNHPFDFSRRIPQLDGVRGVAILMVLCFHYAMFLLGRSPGGILALALTPFRIGWAGVDLFFVLSGFLIGGILLDAKGSRSYFSTFYTRRVCRIFPLYFAFLALAAAVCTVERWGAGLPVWSCVAFVQNFWMAAHVAGGDSVLGHTWSVAVEEQFYLTLPALLYFAKPRQIPKILIAGIVLGPCARAVCFATLRSPGPAAYALLPCRMDSLLIGVMTAWLLRCPGAREFLRLRRQQLWTATEVLTLAAATFFLQQSQDGRVTAFVVYESLALLFACVIALSLVDERLAGLLRARWLMGLGSIAYGVYLLHPLVLRATALFVTNDAAAVLVAAGATVAVAKISWEYFEKPIVRFGHRAVYNTQSPARATQPTPAVAD